MSETIKEPENSGTSEIKPVEEAKKKTISTRKTFKEYAENLEKNDIPTAKKEWEVAQTAYYGKRLARAKQKAHVLKAEATLALYQSLSDNITIYARKDASEIKKKIDAAIDMSDKTITAKLATAHAKLKAAKEKLKIVQTAAEDLYNSRRDSSISDDVSVLTKAFKDGTPKLRDNDENLADDIRDILHQAKNTFNLVDDAVEVSVKVAGIHALSSVATLRSTGQQILEHLTGLHNEVTAGITLGKTKRDAARQKLEKNMEELVESKYGKYAGKLGYAAILDTASQVEEQDCKGWSHEELADYLNDMGRKVEENFDDLLRI